MTRKHIFGGSEVLVASLRQARMGPPIPSCPSHGGGWRKVVGVWHRSITSLQKYADIVAPVLLRFWSKPRWINSLFCILKSIFQRQTGRISQSACEFRYNRKACSQMSPRLESIFLQNLFGEYFFNDFETILINIASWNTNVSMV